MPHQAEIIAVGTELLLGNIVNTNAQFLSELLASAGIDVLYHTAVGDNPRRLRQAVEIARGRCDLLVFTGGLGPTYDDMTKETVAEAFGLALEYHPEVMEEIQCYFDNVFHRPMPACNRQQAMLPQGCTVLHNPVGTAPGCIFTADGVTAVLLPGVPHECRYLAEHALLPWLQGCSGGVICSHDLRVFGLTEPRVQELLGDLMDRAENPSLAPYAKPGEVMLRLTAKGESPQDCQERMISVSGVGPKAALSILSGMTPQAFALCVASGDGKTLTNAPGIGRKTAERIVLELKDKVSKQDVAAGVKGSAVPIVAAPSNTYAEAVSALMVLGYSNGEAASALSGLDPSAPSDELIRAGLKKLAKF